MWSSELTGGKHFGYYLSATQLCVLSYTMRLANYEVVSAENLLVHPHNRNKRLNVHITFKHLCVLESKCFFHPSVLCNLVLK